MLDYCTEGPDYRTHNECYDYLDQNDLCHTQPGSTPNYEKITQNFQLKDFDATIAMVLISALTLFWFMSYLYFDAIIKSYFGIA